jgi:large subunit ribosomal protein L4
MIMQVDILNIQGKPTGKKIELPEAIFGIEPNEHVVYLAVKQYLAARHQGTHKVKTRSEVIGSTRKLHKQKGTGGSRKGGIRNPLYRGGGTIFGPKPHSYDFKLNKKVKDLAKISALSHKYKENALLVVEDIQLEAPKTKQIAQMLHNMNLADKKTLFVQLDYNEPVSLSIRNIPNVLDCLLADMNTYDIVNADVLMLTESAANLLNAEPEELEMEKA